jgi:hypothetical protein
LTFEQLAEPLPRVGVGVGVAACASDVERGAERRLGPLGVRDRGMDVAGVDVRPGIARKPPQVRLDARKRRLGAPGLREDQGRVAGEQRGIGDVELGEGVGDRDRFVDQAAIGKRHRQLDEPVGRNAIGLGERPKPLRLAAQARGNGERELAVGEQLGARWPL